MRTLKELAQEALDIQDACNLSGVLLAWSEAIQELMNYWRTGKLTCTNTDEFNRHPINRLWASKVHELSAVPTLDPVANFSTAYDACQLLVKEG